MAFSKTRTLTLSLSLLLASTSLASAGFIWLSPDQQPNQQEAAQASAPVVAQAESPVADGTQTQGRAWKAAEAMSAPTASAPVLEAPASAPVEVQPVQTAAVLLRDETVSSAPVYAKGDQKSAPVAPAPALVAPVAPAPVESAAPVAPTPAPAQEHVLGQLKDTVESAPAALASETKPVELTPAQAPAPTPVAPVASSAPVSLITGAPVAAAPTPAPSATEAKVVDGFGKQVPLVIALRQILPPDYGFAHRDGVDLTQSVDWQGGRPWPQVLNDAIAPIGLKATITADTVLLEKVAAPVAAATPAAPTPVAPAPEAAAPVVLTPAPVAAPEASPTSPAMAPELTVPAQPATSSAPAVLTNATIMQAVPSGK